MKSGKSGLAALIWSRPRGCDGILGGLHVRGLGDFFLSTIGLIFGSMLNLLQAEITPR